MHPYGLYINKNDQKFGQLTLAKFSKEGMEPDILRRPHGSYGRSSTRRGLFGLKAVAKHFPFILPAAIRYLILPCNKQPRFSESLREPILGC